MISRQILAGKYGTEWDLMAEKQIDKTGRLAPELPSLEQSGLETQTVQPVSTQTNSGYMVQCTSNRTETQHQQ